MTLVSPPGRGKGREKGRRLLKRFVVLSVSLFLGLVLPAGCGSGGFTLSSKAFDPGEPIPPKYTAYGDEVSPPLSWSDPPAGTKSLALIVEDPDAPDPENPKTVLVHWLVYDIPATARELPEGAAGGKLPGKARQGRNHWGKKGYTGPTPLVGVHRYFFRLFALDKELGDLSWPGKEKLLAAMKGHILGKAELVGTCRAR